MMVIATKNEAPIAMTTLLPMEPTKSPAFPGRSRIGMKASIVVRVEDKSGTKRWRTESRTAAMRA
jgi:hypothetical protein